MLISALKHTLRPSQVVTDYALRYAYSTDASYFRIVPKVVVTAHCLSDVSAVLALSSRYQTPVTLRAAGTSVSGQAIGPGVLLFYRGTDFEQLSFCSETKIASMGTNLRGGRINEFLAPYGRKIGPDPATVNIAKLGGMVANNSSGMCCGTKNNAYQTLRGLRVLLMDGALLDTAQKSSVDSFRISHANLLQNLSDLANEIRENQYLSAMIRRKYEIKNTVGYSLNALLDFDDPIDMLAHLMVGSEGTLGFVQEVHLETVNVPKLKASALIAFQSVLAAADAIPALKAVEVDAAELLDWRSIVAMRDSEGVPGWLNDLAVGSALLLVQVAGESKLKCEQQIAEIRSRVCSGLVRPIQFSFDVEECAALWKVRSGLFPRVGAIREANSSVIIEDVAVPIDQLATLTERLAELIDRYEQKNGVIFGHALDGNLHFLVTPNLNNLQEQLSFGAFMEAVVDEVTSLNGSLKAEHGTGRAMAPFVEHEWGRTAYGIMKRLKKLFDPDHLLNPDVIISDVQQLHLKDIKSSRPVDDEVDQCIECGFCEPICPTTDLSLSPRQRISLARAGLDAPYHNEQSCVRCGLCQIACPVGINTGDLTKRRLGSKLGMLNRRFLSLQATYWSTFSRALSATLFIYKKLPHETVKALNGLNLRVPKWLPSVRPKVNTPPIGTKPVDADYILFNSCSARFFGEREQTPVEVMLKLAELAGLRVTLLPNESQLCCGQWWDAKGEKALGQRKRRELERELNAFNGTLVTESLSCHETLKTDVRSKSVLDWLLEDVVPRLDLKVVDSQVMVHRGCTSFINDLDRTLYELAKRCVRDVHQPPKVKCCAGGGDMQFFQPEIAELANPGLAEEYDNLGIEFGVYANASCEQNLQRLTNVKHIHIVELIEMALDTKAR